MEIAQVEMENACREVGYFRRFGRAGFVFRRLVTRVEWRQTQVSGLLALGHMEQRAIIMVGSSKRAFLPQ